MERKTKQIIIISVYLLIFIGGIFLIYKIFWGASCSDGKKNGGEEGIDCGGPCPKPCAENVVLQKLQTGPVSIIKYKGKFDVALEVTNVNDRFGFEKVSYATILYKGEEEVGRKEGKFYILPNEIRYLIETGIECKDSPDNAKVIFKEEEWGEYKKREKPKLEILNKVSKYGEGKGNFFEVNFQLANRSSYDFFTVDLDAVLKDKNNKIIAVNKANLNAVEAGEVRDFRFIWPTEFEGQVDSIEIKAQSNIFDLQNISS
jgi:hypothetical protein